MIVATCSVIYSGRGDTRLEARRRAVIIKDDGAVSVHSGMSNKPLNYMNAPNTITWTDNPDGTTVIAVDSRKESLLITLHEVHEEFTSELSDDEPGLVRDGTEAQLQEWLSTRPELFGEGYELVSREYRTTAGAVDLLFRHLDGHYLAVEVKRVAMLGAVDQILRYVGALREEFTHEVRGLIAALDLRPPMLVLAEKKGVGTLKVDWRSPAEAGPGGIAQG